jgi:hypothetical protein
MKHHGKCYGPAVCWILVLLSVPVLLLTGGVEEPIWVYAGVRMIRVTLT